MIIFFLCFYFTRRWWARDIADAPVNTQHKTHWHNTCMGRICRRQTLASGKPYLFALNLLWLMWAWFYRVIETEDLLDIEELKSFSVMLMFGLSCISQSVSGRIYANAIHRLLFRPEQRAEAEGESEILERRKVHYFLSPNNFPSHNGDQAVGHALLIISNTHIYILYI